MQDCRQLDTNRDGVLNRYDDMFTPFYPGDDVVDWVAMSVLHYGQVGDQLCSAVVIGWHCCMLLHCSARHRAEHRQAPHTMLNHMA